MYGGHPVPYNGWGGGGGEKEREREKKGEGSHVIQNECINISTANIEHMCRGIQERERERRLTVRHSGMSWVCI